jgi:opacity protein-like surface antigen
MSSVKIKLFASTAIIAMSIGAASAADMAIPVVYEPAPQVFSGWYLRGDIGMSNQKLKELDYFRYATAPGFTWLDKGGFDSAPFFGLGIGYQFNNWFRMDLTGEYRGKADFHALDRYDTGSNEYGGTKSEWLFMANAYVDLGTWWCVTPFIGAGVGFAKINIDHFTDMNTLAAGGGYAESGSTTNFAWALHAGLAYKVTPNFTVELAYRYLDMGDGETGIAYNLNGTTSGQVFTFKDITSHDIKFGMRWALDGGIGKGPVAPAVYAPPPAPIYTPPPVYKNEQPPLMRRG